MSIGDAMGMGAEPEPQGEVTFSAEQKVDNFLKSKTKDHKETSPQGLSGPELQAQVRAVQCPAAPRPSSPYAGAAPAAPLPRAAAPNPCLLTPRGHPGAIQGPARRHRFFRTE